MRHFDGRIALKLDRKGEARRVFLDFFEQGVSSAFWLRISVRRYIWMHGISALVLKCDAWKTWTYNMWSIGNKFQSFEIFGIEYIWVLKWFSS
ncbi:hypothetical protein RIR_jg11599.t1 [Rhizophagus irregularis DAOM 181602=DAOM 197198]|nr:hypothetical protein RIR_jg11599.t1 [Rhizophagus irregularis DAOM 181602=DAOM 197198]